MRRSPLILVLLAPAVLILSACASASVAPAPPHMAGATTAPVVQAPAKAVRTLAPALPIPTLALPTLGLTLPRASSSPVQRPEVPTSVAAPATPAAAIAPDPGDWPMFRYDLNHTGYNPNELALKPPLRLVWQHKAEAKI